jgi:hypothetical protein
MRTEDWTDHSDNYSIMKDNLEDDVDTAEDANLIQHLSVVRVSRLSYVRGFVVSWTFLCCLRNHVSQIILRKGFGCQCNSLVGAACADYGRIH